jgi:hypothetical protein
MEKRQRSKSECRGIVIKRDAKTPLWCGILKWLPRAGPQDTKRPKCFRTGHGLIDETPLGFRTKRLRTLAIVLSGFGALDRFRLVYFGWGKTEDCGEMSKVQGPMSKVERDAPLPSPMASQARHEMDAPQELCAPRNVVPTPASCREGEDNDSFGGFRRIRSVSSGFARFLSDWERPRTRARTTTRTKGNRGLCRLSWLTAVLWLVITIRVTQV